MARIVVPDYPHHVTQRGNRRQTTFFSSDDYHAYIRMLASAKKKADVQIWAYCLMPNHVHVIVVPQRKDSLANLFRDAHRRYTRRVNLRENWRGHLWQERFHSFPMNEQYLLAAVRYTELNPVRAGLVSDPKSWAWSSVNAHIRGQDDLLVDVAPMLRRISDWDGFLSQPVPVSHLNVLRKNGGTGRPAGDDAFIGRLEGLTGRTLRRKKTGPKSSN